jgi:cytochrome c6
MKKIFTIVLTTAALFSFATAGVAKEETKAKSGEELFKTHCAECHVDGSNIIDPMKTLHKKDRDANNIKKPKDIIEKMRNPGPGMTKFDKTTISDKDAKKIAEYILKTFN